MKKYVVLSTNDNPDYYNYIPYVIKAWNKLGWKCITFLREKEESLQHLVDGKNIFYTIKGESKYRDETLVQVSRLFAGHLVEDGLIMTADGDMMPCSDYWKPNEEEVTVYGHDLTQFGWYPICYIAMNSKKWKEIMNITDEDLLVQIESLLDKYDQAKSEEFMSWWHVDQDIITERLNNVYKRSILRGRDDIFGFLAKGRIDRWDWVKTKQMLHAIDAHMPRPFDRDEAEYIIKKYHS